MPFSSMRSTASISSRATVAIPQPIARAALAIFLVATAGNAAHLFDPLRLLRALPELCPIHRLLGVDCPGCGMGRALAHLTKGELGTAVTLHPFAPVLLLLALGYALAPRDAIVAIERDRLLGSAVPALLIAAILTWWFCAKVL